MISTTIQITKALNGRKLTEAQASRLRRQIMRRQRRGQWEFTDDEMAQMVDFAMRAPRRPG